MRRAARRDENEPAIVQALEAVGCTVTRLNERGVTDLLVGRNGTNYLMEVKDPSKPKRDQRLTPDQETWHGTWQGQKAVVKSVTQALAVIGLYKDET